MFVCILMFFALSLIGFCFVFVYGIKEILTKNQQLYFCGIAFPDFCSFLYVYFYLGLGTLMSICVLILNFIIVFTWFQLKIFLFLFFRLSVVSFPNAIERRLVAISAFYASSGLKFSYIS